VPDVRLQDVIFDKMNALECALARQDHLDKQKRGTLWDQISWLNRMNIALGQKDKEILQFAINAFEDKTEWK
jgi:hypothetical protein|tara:strand:- start:658 stop:873 length:216 start_codon:yes stop_codon:yes gene_type:complete